MTQRIQNCGACSATCIFETFKWYINKHLFYRWHSKAGFSLERRKENIKTSGTKPKKDLAKLTTLAVHVN
jgi:hypothetical protein